MLDAHVQLGGKRKVCNNSNETREEPFGWLQAP